MNFREEVKKMATDRQYRNFSRYIAEILPGLPLFDFTDKDRNVADHIKYMLSRTQSMFRWDGLPDSVPARILELFLQVNGNVCWYRHEGILYVFTGGLGGEPDVYYRPTICTIANPALRLSKSLRIDEECVIMPNDALYQGMMPMFFRYATAMSETELSLDIACVNSRIIDLMSAPDDRTKASAEEFLRQVRAGKIGVIAENAFLDGIRAQPYGTTGHSTITDLIELEQYHKASWFNDLGLNANYNMKRESLNSAESQLNNDALLPLVDDMLRCRQLAAEKVNAMFGTEILVSLASSWEDNQEEIDLEQESMDPEPKQEQRPEEDERNETPD